MVGGITVSVDTLRGMEDVEFDFGVSAQVKGDFIVAASQMRSVLGAMPGLRSAALVQFEGYYSTIFADNGATQTRTATRSPRRWSRCRCWWRTWRLPPRPRTPAAQLPGRGPRRRPRRRRTAMPSRRPAMPSVSSSVAGTTRHRR